ncbi:ABC transporter ATP-binding protein [Acinetobacter sp. P1(2023)]|uniref:putative type VI secretion system effector n=1 Tax=Acinetobacter TaxID=469 RepID=UPI0021CDC191|nr:MULTISPECIES: putative type VI secretion system effector [Acinetobacter]MCU4528699.1 ABC transporter ATP-binding protein [Acinetobacter sp. WU_MDCI_Abxe169]MDC0840783.1 ABC transporter ATP-binding protein [Acinetobacter sp. P1(2023)]MDX8237141.1 putative type VI secretion system effector [Acinetobacter pittii]
MKLHLQLVQGPIHSLDKAKSKIPVNQDVGGIAAGTAFAGVLAGSSSLLTSSPILLMAGKAKDGITFIGEIDGYPVIGQFTTVRFKENDELIAVISEKPVDGRYQVYAIVDPKSGLLYMIYEMGRSVKMGYRAIMMQTYFFSALSFGLFMVILIFSFISSSDYSGESILFFFETVLITFFISVSFSAFINYFSFRKSYENFGNLSEQIFEKLCFENPTEQDFYNDFLTDDGVQISVMKYRKKLKGKDPYPEDYFDKKNFLK